MPVHGLTASLQHPENGMTHADMVASQMVANALDEVIIFRSTGPWSRRWLERHYPSKNFHVKGKSSDWGPHAGFVPYLGVYSKVGHIPAKAEAGTTANNDGLASHFAGTRVLELTWAELQMQLTQPEERVPRTALHRIEPLLNSRDYLLFARRSGDGREFAFRARWNGAGVGRALADTVFHIHAFPPGAGVNPRRLAFESTQPLLVMTSREWGASNLPMTGDYDLMAVCPPWRSYGARSGGVISKPGLEIKDLAAVQPGLAFPAGMNLDQVMTMESNTGIKRPPGWKERQAAADPGYVFGRGEHADMGNLTPRILRCITSLNNTMPRGRGPFRRVHHNAESHRNVYFKALTEAEMRAGEGLPLTIFQPNSVRDSGVPGLAAYRNVSTLETLAEFRVYAGLLQSAGYFVPRNWSWGMSIRDAGRPV